MRRIWLKTSLQWAEEKNEHYLKNEDEIDEIDEYHKSQLKF